MSDKGKRIMEVDGVNSVAAGALSKVSHRTPNRNTTYNPQAQISLVRLYIQKF